MKKTTAGYYQDTHNGTPFEVSKVRTGYGEIKWVYSYKGAVLWSSPDDYYPTKKLAEKYARIEIEEQQRK